jgi:hypothetical protein
MLYKLNVSHQLTGENVERVVLLTAVVQPFICSKSLYSTEGAIKMKQVTTITSFINTAETYILLIFY